MWILKDSMGLSDIQNRYPCFKDDKDIMLNNRFNLKSSETEMAQMNLFTKQK